MAYIATGTHNDSNLSDADQALVASYKQMWNNATTQAEKDAAHAAAEGVRAKYGYSGGDDGSNYYALAGADNTSTSTNTGSTFNASNYDLSSYLREQQAARTQAALDNLQSAYEKSLRGYEQQEEQIPDAYNQARNTLAAQRANTQRSFDERAAASGLNSGTAGQSTLARDSAYIGGISDINEAQATAESDLALAKANLLTDYENAIAQAKNSGDAELADALYNELIRVQNIELNADEIAAQYGLNDTSGSAGTVDTSDITGGTVTTQSSGKSGGTSNGFTLDKDEIAKMQAWYGTTADGIWGKNSTATAAGKGAGAGSLEEAWKYYQANSGGVSGGVVDRVYDKTKVTYNHNNGNFVWNGKTYTDEEKLMNDIDNANLTAYQKQQLQNSFAAYGMKVTFS